MISFKGRHHQQDIILQCVRWYVAYSLSYRDLEELMQERGYTVDHSTVQRWVVHYVPRIEKVFRKNKKRVGNRWRLDETYVKIKGEWKYLYRAVDKQGDTVDFLLTARCDKKAARRFLNKAIGSNGKPSLINIDKNSANTAVIKQYNNDENKRIEIRQCKYLNNIVEQVVRHSDHRCIKRIIRPMLGFKSFWAARHCPNHRWRGLVTPAKRGRGVKSISNAEVRSPAERHAAMTWAQARGNRRVVTGAW